MSYDLYFWPSGVGGDPAYLAEQLAEEEAEFLRPDDGVLAFRQELLRRWPELADVIAPWHHDLDWRLPWGRTDLADRFVGLTLPSRWPHRVELPNLAAGHGLACYDPQVEALLPPSSPQQPISGYAQIGGWVSEDNVVTLMRRISEQIGYAYDDLDETALVGALDDTDDEEPDAWFEYPLHGNPSLTVHLAQSSGGTVVSVRVEGVIDQVLAARIETMLDLL